MKSIIQEEPTGCAIASTAVLAGVSYKKAKEVANNLGIYAEDTALWSKTDYIRKLLFKFKVETDKKETPFTDWSNLPDCALLSIKWHLQEKKPFWHWVVFVRENGDQYIFDSSTRLKTNIRKDFGRIKPKWFIGVQLKMSNEIPFQRIWLTGQDYLEASEILLNEVRILPAAILAALSIELYLKSFLAARDEKGYPKITLKNHHLLKLFDAIDPINKEKILQESKKIDSAVNFTKSLEKHNEVFIGARYFFEADSANSVGSDTVYFARHLSKIVYNVGIENEKSLTNHFI